MKVYIAGKITGDPYYRAKFAQAERALTAAGHIVLNPAVLPEGMGKADYMRICLAMLDSADAIGLLHGWGNSPGARIEHDLARYNGKQVIYTWQLPGYKA
nr:MAG TPA_asm: N-deoxyribosyltransferase [Caudoviricetes sp.]